jgi:hypothetical protein
MGSCCLKTQGAWSWRRVPSACLGVTILMPSVVLNLGKWTWPTRVLFPSSQRQWVFVIYMLGHGHIWVYTVEMTLISSVAGAGSHTGSKKRKHPLCAPTPFWHRKMMNSPSRTGKGKGLPQTKSARPPYTVFNSFLFPLLCKKQRPFITTS